MNKQIKYVIITSILALFLSNTILLASPLTKKFVKTYGGEKFEYISKIIPNKDSGFIAVGHTNHKGAGGYDGWIIGISNDGELFLDKTFGGSEEDRVSSIAPLLEGGYMVVGSSESQSSGEDDLWVVKLDVEGSIVWEKKFGGRYDDRGEEIYAFPDGRTLIVGSQKLGKNSKAGWMLMLSSKGQVVWEKQFTNRKFVRIKTISYLSENRFLIAGNFGDKEYGDSRAWWMHIDELGNIITSNSFDNPSTTISEVVTLADGSAVVVGSTNFQTAGKYDIWVMKMDAEGEVIWQRSYGREGQEYGDSVAILPDGHYFVVGTINKANKRKDDIWSLRLTQTGDKIWEQAFGSDEYEGTESIISLPDGAVVIAGSTIDGAKKNVLVFSYLPSEISEKN